MNSVWRPWPGWIAALFIWLLLVAAAERRHAELYVTWLDGVAFENAEEPEGDEIAKRLVITEDNAPPCMPCTARLTEVRRTAADPRPPRLHPIPDAGSPEPRAPPLV